MDKASPNDADKAVALAALEKLPDDVLKEVLSQGQAMLKARANDRRREALREIQRLAKEHGIRVDVSEPRGKRGRPAKAKGAASG